MRTDIVDLHHFYDTPLGMLTRQLVGSHVKDLFGDVDRLRIAGFGYATPYLGDFDAARSIFAFAPDAQGVMRWPQAVAPSVTNTGLAMADESGSTGKRIDTSEPRNRACLVHEGYWPLPDRCLDRLLIVHGLEEVRDASRLMREAWRVLADDGRLVIVAAQRRGLWATLEATPLAAGRPWLRGQLSRLLTRNMFQPVAWHRALHFPPSRNGFILKTAKSWEQTGRLLWPGFCGVLIVDARKQMTRIPKGTPQRAFTVIRPQLAKGLTASSPARCGAATDLKRVVFTPNSIKIIDGPRANRRAGSIAAWFSGKIHAGIPSAFRSERSTSSFSGE